MATNYAQRLYDLTAKALGYETVPPQDGSLVRLYTLLGMVLGPNVTGRHVHDAWALWTALDRQLPNHPCLVPYEALTDAAQALDEPYADAIRRAYAAAVTAALHDEVTAFAVERRPG